MSEKEQILEKSLMDIATEYFRFQNTIQKLLGQMDIVEQKKYLSQFKWFSKSVSKALETANLNLVNLEGQVYDPGMAVTPLNLDDFDLNDKIIVSQMIEPIIMKDDKICKMGTVLLGGLK